jgi:protein arginine N-methyltransferase 3
VTDLPSATRRIRALEKRLTDAKQDLADYREFVGERLNLSHLTDATDDSGSIAALPRDDDSHYFESYNENGKYPFNFGLCKIFDVIRADIHATMIQDNVRTSSYAQFIMTNPTLFRDAIVLDVGCGTGILSLFAAKSGAKRVIAVDASDIAKKAATIVQANGLDNVIT